jgi:molybdate transport system substrate-binding protein
MLRNSSLLVALAALAAFAAHAHAGTHARITVYAAASLTDVFPQIEPGERYSFGGSNTLAAQIQQGAPADVFASANRTLPARLFAHGLCSKPVVFARNTLVVVVPKSNRARIHAVFDLAKPGVKLVVAGPGVPVGAYTLKVLKQLNLATRVLKNVVSRESDVRGVLAKVALGEADAGFVYATDARTVPRKLAVIELPARANADVQYGICLVSSSADKTDGQAFVDEVLSKAGQAKLVAAGFLPRIKPAARKR